VEIGTRTAIVGLALSTALIHASLGGSLFMVNAVGFATLSVAMVAPGPFASQRWLVRVALMGFAATTIAGWLLVGARFPLAYLTKALEIVLVALLAIELWHHDGGPAAIARRATRLAGDIRSIVLLVVAAGALAACSGAPAEAAPPPSVPAGAAAIAASGSRFDRDTVEVPSGRAFPLLFDNRDGVFHNVTIVEPATGHALFTGEVFGGPAARAYQVPALVPGRYGFRCDVHPEMTGTLVAG
jgi:plastocyanin